MPRPVCIWHWIQLTMSTEAKTIKAGELLQLCWLIANAEAKHLGATEIEPIHFLLAVLKVADPKFPEQLDALNVSSADWASMCREAQSVRNYIDIIPDRVTAKRRRLRARLNSKRVNPPIDKEGMLHRSESLKRGFADAIRFENGDVLTLYDVVQSLFELELVSLRDVDNKSWVSK